MRELRNQVSFPSSPQLDLALRVRLDLQLHLPCRSLQCLCGLVAVSAPFRRLVVVILVVAGNLALVVNAPGTETIILNEVYFSIFLEEVGWSYDRAMKSSRIPSCK